MTTTQTELFAAPGEIAQRGLVKKVRFHNEENGWSIIVVGVDGKDQTWVGTMPKLRENLEVQGVGKFESGGKWGEQFKVTTVAPIDPTTSDGIAEFLGSGLVSGVGPMLAARIVGIYGAQTLDVLENDLARVKRDVRGIGAAKLEALRTALIEHKAVGQIMVWLRGHGISASLATKLYKHYGSQAITVVSEAPYRMAMEISGIGWKTADELAKRLGTPMNAPDRIQAGLLHTVDEVIGKGHCYATRRDLLEAATELLGIDADTIAPFIRTLCDKERLIDDQGSIYPANLFDAEVNVAERLRTLMSTPARQHDGAPLTEHVVTAIKAFESKTGFTMADAQRDAVNVVASNKVSVVTGGPGCGKTTITKCVLNAFDEAKIFVTLAAPTGRAAKRMSEATGSPASTIHRLLSYDPDLRGFAFHKGNRLPVRVLVLDECSMVDVSLMSSLLDALPDDARLIIVGDVDQLPSVGPGSVLRDIIDSGAVPVARLSVVYRQAEGSLIINNAHRINRGEKPETGPRDGDFHLITIKNGDADVPAMIEAMVRDRVPAAYKFDPLTQIQVLSPMNKGPTGVIALNERLQATINPPDKDKPEVKRGKTMFRLGDRVLQTKNDYDRDVFNGDIGRIIEVYPGAVKDEPILAVDIDGKPVPYTASHLEHLQLAYCTSIHKSQGGQQKVVIVVMLMSHFMMLSRNLLYTAVTRGEKLVVLVTEARALAMALAETRKELRRTKLALRLSNLLPKPN